MKVGACYKMLTIRNDQLVTLTSIAMRQFENEMLAHCFKFSPKLCELLGERRVRRFVRVGIAAARQHHFSLRGTIRLYIEMMFLFGSSFDSDPQYEWAASVLQQMDGISEMQRAERLHANTSEYLNEVAGPENIYTIRALRDVRRTANSFPDFERRNFVDLMRIEIKRCHPHKYYYVGADAIVRLIEKGVKVAQTHDFALGREAATVVILMFAFGHGCIRDPLYPWIAMTLKDQKIVDPSKRAQRMERKAITWLDRVLSSEGEMQSE